MNTTSVKENGDDDRREVVTAEMLYRLELLVNLAESGLIPKRGSKKDRYYQFSQNYPRPQLIAAVARPN